MSKLIGRRVKVRVNVQHHASPLHEKFEGATGVIVEDPDNMLMGLFINAVAVKLDDNDSSHLPFFPVELRYLNNREVKV